VSILALPIVALAACGRSRGVPDQDLGGLVIAPKQQPAAIDVERATKHASELGRAMSMPEAAALGRHSIAIATQTRVTEGGKEVSQLDDKVSVEVAGNGTFHATYTNSADYGREVIFVDGKLYLRPRYQRWHVRPPETPDEPAQILDSFYEAPGAAWDLLAPAAEPSDKGKVEVSGRPGRKIVVDLASSPRTPATEPLAQRKWREQRTVEALYGEVVLDAERGVPLSVRLQGTVGFARDGRQFSMKLVVNSDVTTGQSGAVAAPPQEDVVATPERQREVDDRDFLLQGIAPPLRKNPDGTAIKPVPAPGKTTP
jgi:hypothetical protein